MKENSRYRDFIIGSGQTHSLKDFVNEVFKYLDISKTNLKTNVPKYKRKIDLRGYKANIKDTRKILKWQPKLKFKTTPTHSLEELHNLISIFPKEIVAYVSKLKSTVVGGFIIFHANKNTSLIFYNIIDTQMTESQLSVLQLYNCIKICKSPS